MATFSTNRSLLNPKFNGYKLLPVDEADHIVRFPLHEELRPSQANVSGRSRTPLSFEEVQARIKHNHLAISWDGRQAAYVDREMHFCLVTVDEESNVQTKMALNLPQTIETEGAAETVHKEYPSAASVDGAWVVSDGMGSLHVLAQREGELRISSSHCLPGPERDTPFKLHVACLLPDGTVSCILSSRQTDGSIKAAKTAQFDVMLVDLSISSGKEDHQVMRLIWRGRGSDVPIYTDFDSASNSFVVFGSTAYRASDSPVPLPYEAAEDELMPIPGANEMPPDPPSRPPPYSWTQTPDSVTVAFALPSNISKTNIHVTLTTKTLSLLVRHELPAPTPLPLPRYALSQLWDGINASSSFWTWDREADKHYGLLTLHLDKQNEGTRWSQVFAHAGTSIQDQNSEAEAEAEVLETLDSSELHSIRESLEKYTSALQTGEDASGLGLGSGMPSLAEGEMDESVDSSIGRTAVVTWIPLDGPSPKSTSEPSISVLSLPLPGAIDDAPSVVTQNDIDGLLFALTQPGHDIAIARPWVHMATFSALAFVLASKRDTRFVFHAGAERVLAFESGSSVGGGNVFMYHGSKRGDASAKQAVLKVSGGSSGPLLGVGRLNVEGGKDVLVCLCEREIVVIRDVL